MKKEYIAPDLEPIEMEAEQIIAASGNLNDFTDDNLGFEVE